jgi:hypothetical protein
MINEKVKMVIFGKGGFGKTILRPPRRGQGQSLDHIFCPFKVHESPSNDDKSFNEEYLS